jgi:ribosome biogenesis protein YTM1
LLSPIKVTIIVTTQSVFIKVTITVDQCVSMDSSIRVRFNTEYDQFRVVDTPFAVPTKLGRIGLSEVINHLLQSQPTTTSTNDDTSTKTDFDFVINDILLRTSLHKFLETHRLSNEDILVIHYVPAMHIPDESTSTELPSWVGCINTKFNSCIFTGSYNGQIQLFNPMTLALYSSIQGHDQAIRSLTTFSQDGDNFLLSGSKNHSIKCHALTESKNIVSLTHVATCKGHSNSVESLDVWESNNNHILLSGDWNGNIFGWNLSTISTSSASKQDEDSSTRKKKKLNTSVAQHILDITPIFTLRGHSQSVSCIQTIPSSNKVFSCSWDHSLKEWDMERQDCLHTFVGSKVMTSLDYSLATETILTSHTDGKVRLWDPRDKEAGVNKLSFGAESKHWISQVMMTSF